MGRNGGGKNGARVPVVILCGGMGTRLAEETETKPKPLVEIGGRPILWHLMKHYSHHGFNDFILCLGYKGHLIRDYFLNYDYNARDIRVKLGNGGREVETLGRRGGTESWNVTLADTGNAALTGARVKRIEKYIEGKRFMLTYGDGLSTVDIRRLSEFHDSHGRIGTVTGVRPPSRFGELIVGTGADRDRVLEFAEKPATGRHKGSVSGYINGGFFVFGREFFRYLDAADECVLEREPLERLSADGELMVHAHSGFWQCMDTMRDVLLLRQLWDSGKPPWKGWKE
jgi:glucose-1-phosphate cytidylyltransferase